MPVVMEVHVTEGGSRHDRPIPMSLKQLCQTVRSGQLVTFLIFDGDPVTGYLAGIDDAAYFVLEPFGQEREQFNKKVITKSGSPMFQIHPEPTYKEESAHDEMEEIIRPFRSWALSNVFGQSKPSARAFDQKVAS